MLLHHLCKLKKNPKKYLRKDFFIKFYQKYTPFHNNILNSS